MPILRYGRRPLVVLMDLCAVFAAFLVSFLLRFEFSVPTEYWQMFVASVPLGALTYIPAFWLFRLYAGMYRYSSFNDLIRIVKAVATGAVAATALTLFVHHGNYPRSILMLTPILIFLGICGVRFAIRMGKNFFGESSSGGGDVRALIVGAGDMGESLLRQLLKAPERRYQVLGFIDDDRAKWGMHIHDVPILGGRQDLPRILEKLEVEQILIAIGSQRGDLVRSVADAVREAKSAAEIKVAPSVQEMFTTPGLGIALRSVRPSDLLNRKAHSLDEAGLARKLAGKTVLVTGAGGTIGSELCRQILGYGPAKLILLENHATSLFYREMELREKGRKTEIVGILGDITDKAQVKRIFDLHRPHGVLHAAAHKHVGQLEGNVHEGIRTNIFGTYNVAEAAHRHGAECFLLVSTDKAVRPTSVMGATKRAAEMIAQGFNQVSKTKFMAVRFGNVLGSSGSVLKIFQEQIAKGGPITLTHPDVTRYFMTVEEAVQLILHAGTMAAGGEVFILKMGEPVRIYDMARSLILLNGLEPDRDIKIEFIGLRPGEKLNEVLVDDPDGVEDSEHPQIMRLRNGAAALDAVDRHVEDLSELSRKRDPEALKRKLVEMVPGYNPDGDPARRGGHEEEGAALPEDTPMPRSAGIPPAMA